MHRTASCQRQQSPTAAFWDPNLTDYPSSLPAASTQTAPRKEDVSAPKVELLREVPFEDCPADDAQNTPRSAKTQRQPTPRTQAFRSLVQVALSWTSPGTPPRAFISQCCGPLCTARHKPPGQNFAAKLNPKFNPQGAPGCRQPRSPPTRCSPPPPSQPPPLQPLPGLPPLPPLPCPSPTSAASQTLASLQRPPTSRTPTLGIPPVQTVPQ